MILVVAATEWELEASGAPDTLCCGVGPSESGIRTATCVSLDHTELVMVPKRVFETFLNDRANESVRAGLQARCAEILTRDAK